MGGYGSGRHGGWPTVEACDTLVISVDDITRPIRRGLRKLGIQSIADGRVAELPWRTWHWTLSGDDAPWASVECRLELRARTGTAWLRYDVDHFSHRTGPQEYPVSMVTTPCRFGGLRWWWICPATGRRVRKLYLPNGGTRFLSRGPGAYKLAYASQRQGRTDRMHVRSRRLYARLGANYNGPLGNGFPPKPKGMRWRTYSAICDRLAAEARGLDAELLRAYQRLTAHFRR